MDDPSVEPEHTPMLDGTDFMARLETVETRLARHAALDKPTGLTEPDPGGEERWEAGQVWAHIAEFVPYWHGEIQSVVGAYAGDPVPFGRTKEDPGRLAGIEIGRNEEITDLLERVQTGIADLRGYLNRLSSPEWNAVGRHSIRGDLDVEAIVERFILAHLEEHADQLDGLRASS